jgi:hypothetical protein
MAHQAVKRPGADGDVVCVAQELIKLSLSGQAWSGPKRFCERLHSLFAQRACSACRLFAVKHLCESAVIIKRERGGDPMAMESSEVAQRLARRSLCGRQPIKRWQRQTLLGVGLGFQLVVQKSGGFLNGRKLFIHRL